MIRILFIHQFSSAKVENTASDYLNLFLKHSLYDIEKISKIQKKNKDL